jgi:hypothetical protein
MGENHKALRQNQYDTHVVHLAKTMLFWTHGESDVLPANRDHEAEENHASNLYWLSPHHHRPQHVEGYMGQLLH